MRRFFLTSAALVAIALAGFLTFAPAYADDAFNPVAEHEPYVIRPEVQALHDSLTIGDWHADSLLWNRDLLVRNDFGHLDIPRMVEGNMALQVFTAVTKSPEGQNIHENDPDARDRITLLAMGQMWPPRTWNSLLERALYQAQKLEDFAAEAPEALMIIRTEADLDTLLAARADGSDVVGGLLGIEGAHPLEGDLANLDLLVDAGYRLIALQHFFDNEFGGSLHGIGDQGLTDLGRALVAEVEARGLILDLAHSSEQVVRDVLAMTDMPIIVSHTGTYGHCNSHRNISDDLMVEIAETGGAIGIGFWQTAVCDPTPAGVARAIMAAIDLVGVDHVSLGSDYDGTVTVTFDASEMAALTQALVDAGLDEESIAKVMGENLFRVMRDRLN